MNQKLTEVAEEIEAVFYAFGGDWYNIRTINDQNILHLQEGYGKYDLNTILSEYYPGVIFNCFYTNDEEFYNNVKRFYREQYNTIKKILPQIKNSYLSAEDYIYIAAKNPSFRPVKYLFSEGLFGYEVDAWHVFLNKNGELAVVYECHCSCYDIRNDDAYKLLFFKDKEEAVSYLDKNMFGEIRFNILKKLYECSF